MVGNESWVLDLDFHVFETEVQIMMDLISKRTKIWVRITTGKDFHLSSLFWKRESKTTKNCVDWSMECSLRRGAKNLGLEIWTVLNLKPGPQ